MTLVADFNSSVSVPFQRMRQLLFEQGGGIQEGVVGANDLKVAQRGAGANMSVDVPAGAAWVQIDTGTRNGLGHVYNDAIANVVVSASSGTNPRIDQIILRWNDTSIPTGSGNVPTLEVLTGTATVGATLDNRTGATALPNDCMRLADLLIPTSSTSVVTANIRDRRPWARGAYSRIVDTGGDYTALTTTTFTALSTTRLRMRMECTGQPIRVTARGRVLIGSAAGNTIALVPLVDASVPTADLGTTADTQMFMTPVALQTATGNIWAWDLVLAAGSHLIDLAYKVSGATPSGIVAASATQALIFTVEEILRPNTNNGTA